MRLRSAVTKPTAIMVTLTTLCLGLAGFGWYVLQVIAKQH
jgi:hypothetical protein